MHGNEVELLGGAQDLGTLRIRHEPPGAERGDGRELALPISRTVLRTRLDAASADHRIALVAASLAEKLRRSGYAVNQRWEDVQALADAAIRPRHATDDRELAGLVRLAASRGR